MGGITFFVYPPPHYIVKINGGHVTCPPLLMGGKNDMPPINNGGQAIFAPH